MPGRGRRRVSPPSAPTRRSSCSRRCATISTPSANPASARRSPPTAQARPTGSPPCCASAASAICARSPTATRSENWPQSAVGLAILPLEQGFATDALVVLGEQDILGDRLARAPRRRRNLDEFIAEAASLAAGDLVVHEEHGIGRYEGLETIDVGGAPHDCLKVLYAGDDRLFVPVENIEVLSRYGSEEAGAQLDRLGGAAWQGAQGAGQAAHPRDRRRADPRRRRAPAAPRRGGDPARGHLRGIRRALPLSRDRGPAARDRGHARRHGVGQADGPADLRRCRLRQDRDRVARRLYRRVLRRAGRRGGADDPAGPPAFPQLQPTVRRSAGAHRAAVAPGRAQGGQADQGGPRRRPDRDRHRHPCAARQGCAVLPSRPRHRRRGAAFRRRPEGAAEAAQGRRACADADRDADPAHPAAGALRRARDEHHRHAAGRPPGGAHLRDAVRSGGGARGDPARARPRRADLLRRAAHRRSRRSARGIAQDRARNPRRDGAWPDGADRARKRDDRVRRPRLRPAAVDQHHRIRARYSVAPTR